MMVDLVPFITAGAGLLAGLAIRRRRPTAPNTPAPICPCGGAVSFHEGGTGRCHHQIKRARMWNGAGSAIAYEWVPCGCQHYAGPELISAYSLRPVTLRPTTTIDPSLEAAAAADETPQGQEQS
jgi:hypothetical protein